MAFSDDLADGGYPPEPDQQLVPRYVQIKRLILFKINSGEWPSNYRIPSEKELSEGFGVSRMTVNRALRELAVQDVLVRVQGVGTFVSKNKMGAALMSVRNIADEISSQPDHHHRTSVLLLEELSAVPELAATLGLRAGQTVFHSILLHFDNDVPVQMEDRYVNSLVAPDYMSRDFTRETPHVYLSRVAPLTEGNHIVEAVLPTGEEAAWLKITPDEPCLQMTRKTWSNQQVVTTVRLLYPGSRFRLEGHFYS
ncbi:histidine utilization repressor [Desulfovibrio sp. OttesenSCG-928-I05]|nr:histidine utilization repressor [Desulfovibrio sp. OttesenSCG-928-I05]